MKLMRTTILLLLALLTNDGLVGIANAPAERSEAAAPKCVQGNVSEEVVVVAQRVVSDGASDTADCQSGHCRGSSCHCSCHGVVGGLPASFIAALPLTMATNYPRPFAVVASRHPSPPVRPPRA